MAFTHFTDIQVITGESYIYIYKYIYIYIYITYVYNICIYVYVYVYIYNSNKTGKVLIVKKGEHKKIISILTTSFK